VSRAENQQPGDCVHGYRYHCPDCGGVPVPASSSPEAAAPADAPKCAECGEGLDSSAVHSACHDCEGVDDEMEVNYDAVAAAARGWIGRRKLLFPAEVTRAIEDAFELFIRDAEDGEC